MTVLCFSVFLGIIFVCAQCFISSVCLFDSVISKVVSAPEAKPSALLARPKTPPPPPSPAPAPLHVTPPTPAAVAPLLPAAISPALIPPPSPAITAPGGCKAPVRSVVTETVSNYVVCRMMSGWGSGGRRVEHFRKVLKSALL